MKLAGVNVLFPADSIPEGDEGELIQGVKSWQAQALRTVAHEHATAVVGWMSKESPHAGRLEIVLSAHADRGVRLLRIQSAAAA